MRPRALDRKVLRDLWHLRGPVLAVAIVTACGIATFVAMRSMYYHLRATQALYYVTYGFPDVFARVRRAPADALRAVRALPGVEAAEARVSADVIVDVPGLREPATARLVGVPPGQATRLNRVAIRRGRALSGAPGEGIVSEGFAEANGLVLGDSIGVVLGGRWSRVHIVGIGLSPEFVYELKPGELLPDNRRYGIVWMPEDAVASAFGLRDAWNEVAIALRPGSTAAPVIEALDRQLARYGSRGAYDRTRHVSHEFLSREIEENRTFATVLPAIFLGVAAFLLNLVLARIVMAQREQVGMLKAFGARPSALVRHVTLLALGPTLLGAALGVGVGLWLARLLAGVYQLYFRFPQMVLDARLDVALVAVALSVGAGVVGAIAALGRVARLAPAEAMRPEAPARYAHSWIERLPAFARLGPVGRMTLRAFVRRPVRAAISALGLSFAVAIMIVGSFSYDAIAKMRDVQFALAQREDVALTFAEFAPAAVAHELQRLPGVVRVETVRGLPVRVHHAQRARQLELVEVEAQAVLRRPVGADGAPVAPPEGGITMSRALAEALGARVGDSVRVESLLGRRASHELPVMRLVDDLVGTGAWVTPSTWRRLADGGDAVAGAVLQVEPSQRDALYARLKRMPSIQGVAVRSALLESFDALVERSFAVTLETLLVFACVLATGVVYNTARLALAERGRELASLRVLGFTQGEVARMLFGEQAVLTACALPAGALLGWGLAAIMVWAYQTELFRLPLVISGTTYVRAGLLVVAAAVASGALVWRRLGRLDLVSVLKTRE